MTTLLVNKGSLIPLVYFQVDSGDIHENSYILVATNSLIQLELRNSYESQFFLTNQFF